MDEEMKMTSLLPLSSSLSLKARITCNESLVNSSKRGVLSSTPRNLCHVIRKIASSFSGNKTTTKMSVCDSDDTLFVFGHEKGCGDKKCVNSHKNITWNRKAEEMKQAWVFLDVSVRAETSLESSLEFLTRIFFLSSSSGCECICFTAAILFECDTKSCQGFSRFFALNLPSTHHDNVLPNSVSC